MKMFYTGSYARRRRLGAQVRCPRACPGRTHAAEAEALGFGGVTAVAKASGLSRGTVIRGMAELKTAPKPGRGQRIRRKGAGRKRTVDQDPTLERDLKSLVEPVTRGDPESPLRWTCKSVRQLAAQLNRRGHKTSHRLLSSLGIRPSRGKDWPVNLHKGT